MSSQYPAQRPVADHVNLPVPPSPCKLAVLAGLAGLAKKQNAPNSLSQGRYFWLRGPATTEN